MTDVLERESWIFDMRTQLLQYSMHFTSLILYLLIMLTRPVKCQSVCSYEGVKIVKKIAEDLSKVVPPDLKNSGMLYTPTLADYENCSSSTLTCFALEVKVLFVEIQSVASLRSQQLQRILLVLAHGLQDKMKPCPDCELYREQKAEDFLETLQNVLQWMNVEQNCAPKRKKRHLERTKKLKNMI